MNHGNSSPAFVPNSPFYEGPFGRLCPSLPGWAPNGLREHQLDSIFLKFANERMIERPGLSPVDIASDNALVQELENEFSSQVPAGYTYFGQFVDHDITFDPATSLVRQNDPEKLKNFRTPRLDLDNVYGRGPSSQPYLYANDSSGKFIIGKVLDVDLPDLPRNSQGVALIGDPRNDENSIVCQVQLAFLLAHNQLIDRANAIGSSDAFGDARRVLTWLYQWVVWNDFLKRIVDENVRSAALVLNATPDGRQQWELGLEDIYAWRDQPFIPVEFSGAAYRFGHSMVRNSYQTNNPHQGFGNFLPIFDNTGGADPNDLRGFRALKKENYVQWDWFLEMTTSGGPFPQRARKIDSKLCNALAFLFEGPAGSPMNVLAFRNLKRGWALGLPSGVDISVKMGLPVITDLDELIDNSGNSHGPNESLWYYILKEAEVGGGEKLGPLGSIILAATFAGLLKGDPKSFYNLNPTWTPDSEPLLQQANDAIDDPSWALSSIIRLSGLPVDFT